MVIFLAKNYKTISLQQVVSKTMDKQEVKGEPLSALYFPFTYIREGLLKSVLFFFDSLVLYQPSEWQSSLLYPELVRSNLLRLEVPIPAGSELPVLKRRVRDILSWGDFVFSSGQLGYLKYIKESGIAVEGYGEILAALRGEESMPPAFDELSAIQLFLHLAQEHDQREDETARLDFKVSMQESKLWSELLIDQEKPFQASPASIPDGEDTISIATRLKAWSRLFEKGFHGAGIPFTDRYPVLELLPANELILTIPLPDLSSRDLPDVLESREQGRVLEAVTLIKTYVRQAVKRLATSSWTGENIKGMEDARLKGALQILGEESFRLSNLPPYHLSLYIFPDTPTAGLFSKGVSDERNGFIFLLTKGSAHETI
ncbi:MAG: hypothetical protein Q8O04_01310 [Deltaproteobacteria bacterium]|nr:hypothetical protein [Deltaproteobacteria bacterium]